MSRPRAQKGPLLEVDLSGGSTVFVGRTCRTIRFIFVFAFIKIQFRNEA